MNVYDEVIPDSHQVAVRSKDRGAGLNDTRRELIRQKAVSFLYNDDLTVDNLRDLLRILLEENVL